MRLRGEKPHQGVRSSNPAPYRVRNRCNLRSALGLRAGCVGNRVRSFCSGEQYDSDLGLYYLRARYYNPTTGRFLSRDPEDGDAFDPTTLHKYLYASGDPVNGMDPRGREVYIEYRYNLAIIKYGTYAALTGVAVEIACWFIETAEGNRAASEAAAHGKGATVQAYHEGIHCGGDQHPAPGSTQHPETTEPSGAQQGITISGPPVAGR